MKVVKKNSFREFYGNVNWKWRAHNSVHVHCLVHRISEKLTKILKQTMKAFAANMWLENSYTYIYKSVFGGVDTGQL